MNKSSIVFKMVVAVVISLIVATVIGYGALVIMAHFEVQGGLAFAGFLYISLIVVAIMCPSCKYCQKGMDLLKRR